LFSVNSTSTVIFSAINDYEFQSCEDFLVTQCEFLFLFSLVLIFLLEFYDKIFQFFSYDLRNYNKNYHQSSSFSSKLSLLHFY